MNFPTDLSALDINRPDLETILRRALAQGASDVILTAFTEPIYKINGECVRDEEIEPLASDIIEDLLNEAMNDGQRAQLAARKQIDFSIQLVDQRWRVNIARQRGTNWATMRVIPTKIRTFEELNLPPVLREIADRPRGLILVTGPTGSGKSTTLAAMIDYINRTKKRHIVTVEDPIEFEHENRMSILNQREIGTDAEDFKLALRAILRQAPDVILVGEMRDLETIEAAITAAETGHLVMGTLHTNSAASTITRIIDVFPEEKQEQVRTQLAGNLLAVMSQTLVKRKDNTGRIMAFEIMRNNPALGALIRENKIQQIPNLIRQGKSVGMIGLDDKLAEFYRQGAISIEAALAAALEPRNLEETLRGGAQ